MLRVDRRYVGWGDLGVRNDVCVGCQCQIDVTSCDGVSSDGHEDHTATMQAAVWIGHNFNLTSWT